MITQSPYRLLYSASEHTVYSHLESVGVPGHGMSEGREQGRGGNRGPPEIMVSRRRLSGRQRTRKPQRFGLGRASCLLKFCSWTIIFCTFSVLRRTLLSLTSFYPPSLSPTTATWTLPVLPARVPRSCLPANLSTTNIATSYAP